MIGAYARMFIGEFCHHNDASLCVGMWLEQVVEIRFINPLLDAVIDRFGTKDVQYAKVDETHFSVTAKVEISDQFFGWILGFGKKAKLLYPDDVIDQFRGYMDKIREMY